MGRWRVIERPNRLSVNFLTDRSVPRGEVRRKTTSAPYTWLRSLVVLAAIAAAAPTFAAPVCILVSSTGVSFAAPYDPTSAAPNTGSGTVRYLCFDTQNANLGHPRIELERGPTNTFAYRELRSGANRLRYNLFTDAACTIVWGDGSAGTSTTPTQRSVGFLGYTTVTVFARMFPLQDVAAGAYTDTVRFTLNY